MTKDMRGRRVSLRFRDTDPGMPGGYDVPMGPVMATILLPYVSVHDRLSYYARVDEPLVLQRGKVTRTTDVIGLTPIVDDTQPARDYLSEGLERSGLFRGASVDFVFMEDLPSRIDLAYTLKEQNKDFAERTFVNVCSADVEVVEG